MPSNQLHFIKLVKNVLIKRSKLRASNLAGKGTVTTFSDKQLHYLPID